MDKNNKSNPKDVNWINFKSVKKPYSNPASGDPQNSDNNNSGSLNEIKKALKYTEFYYSDYENYESIDPDPIIPGRPEKPTVIDPAKEDLEVFIYNGNIVNDIKLEYDGVERIVPNVFLHALLANGESVFIKYISYKPYFYIAMPKTDNPEYDQLNFDVLKSKFKQYKQSNKSSDYFNNKGSSKYFDNDIKQYIPKTADGSLPKLCRYTLEYRKRSIGFQNDELSPFVRLEFDCIQIFEIYKRAAKSIYPFPTKSEVDAGIYRNEYFICETKIAHETKFANSFTTNKSVSDKIPQFSWFGWCKLKANNYQIYNPKNHRVPNEEIYSLHSFITEELTPIAKTDIPPFLRESLDIEEIKWNEENSMPDPNNPKDKFCSICSAISPSTKFWSPYFFIFTWGGPVTLPNFDSNGKKLNVPRDHIILKIYKNEADCLNGYAEFRHKFHPEFINTWGGYNFDFAALVKRYNVVPGIKEQNRNFCRIGGFPLKPTEDTLSIQSGPTKIGIWSPLIGEILIDLILLWKKDALYRPRNYKLATVAWEKAGMMKGDMNYQHIKPFFMSGPEKRGILLIYNLQDVAPIIDALNPFDFQTISICKIGVLVPLRVCFGGQQARMEGGIHRKALENNTILSRPPYDPDLDRPIGTVKAGSDKKNKKTISNPLGKRKQSENSNAVEQPTPMVIDEESRDLSGLELDLSFEIKGDEEEKKEN